MTSRRRRLEKIVGRTVPTKPARAPTASGEAGARRWLGRHGGQCGPVQEPTPPELPPPAAPPDERCTFCGGRAVKYDRAAGNPEQVLRCCKRPECLAQWRPLVAAPLWHPSPKRRRRRRRRQKTREA